MITIFIVNRPSSFDASLPKILFVALFFYDKFLEFQSAQSTRLSVARNSPKWQIHSIYSPRQNFLTTPPTRLIDHLPCQVIELSSSLFIRKIAPRLINLMLSYRFNRRDVVTMNTKWCFNRLQAKVLINIQSIIFLFCPPRLSHPSSHCCEKDDCYAHWLGQAICFKISQVLLAVKSQNCLANKSFRHVRCPRDMSFNWTNEETEITEKGTSAAWEVRRFDMYDTWLVIFWGTVASMLDTFHGKLWNRSQWDWAVYKAEKKGWWSVYGWRCAVKYQSFALTPATAVDTLSGEKLYALLLFSLPTLHLASIKNVSYCYQHRAKCCTMM